MIKLNLYNSASDPVSEYNCNSRSVKPCYKKHKRNLDRWPQIKYLSGITL